jgi:uncharacterized radical SAM superfamily Fe-S cluster-containing enzyme
MIEKPVLSYLEVEICEECNLNCKGCSHFAPLVKNGENFDFAGYKKDIVRLSKIFSNIKVLRLMGGEPLLNENIVEILKFTRKTLPKSDIRVVTNAVKLIDMGDEFVECLVKENIKLCISLYPIMKHSKQIIIKFLEEKGIKYSLNEVIKFASRLNVKGDFDGIENSNKCKIKSVTLKEGKIYKCSILANIIKFEKHFGQGIVEYDDGGKIDIYKCDGNEIIKRLEDVNKLCSYCSGNHNTEFDWALSEKKLEEWLI